jgi:formin-binding protein 1
LAASSRYGCFGVLWREVTDGVQDGFKAANAWVAGGIAWLDDIQAFYRERSAIEKEYSAKLNTLAKKYFEKKSKKSTSLSVGDTPTMTPGSLERYAEVSRVC